MVAAPPVAPVAMAGLAATHAGVAAGDAPAGHPAGRFEEASWTWPAMGGRLHVRLAAPAGEVARAASAADRVHRRVDRWASRLTRFDQASELCDLNRHSGVSAASVGPTLAAVLDWAERAEARAPGLVDVTLLDARLAAEGVGDESDGGSHAWAQLPDGRSMPPAVPAGPSAWWLERRARGGIVHRVRPVRFDLDGVGKGWIADRALGLLASWPAALVDADGDIAVRVPPGLGWCASVPHPSAREAPGASGDGDLAVLRLPGSASAATVGLATSGTSVHAWGHGAGRRHHLIDPVTGAPAVTDVVQATVMARSARLAEVLAKSIVIAGSDDGLRLAEADDILAAVLLLEGDEVILSEATVPWLA